MKSLWTKDELLSLIADWKAALKAAATGKSYSIDGRTLTRQDLPVIRDTLAYFQKELDVLNGGSGGLVARKAVVIRR